MTRPRLLPLLLAALTIAGGRVLGAQEPDGALPDGWQLRPDQGHDTPEGFSFRTMAPGWHLTTGDFSGILFRTGTVAGGTYEALMTVHLFATTPQRLEGFGLFVGGDHLTDAAQRYTYFLIRADGKFLIKIRDGDRTRNVADWTASPAIHRLPPGADSTTSVKNVLDIRVTPSAVTFLINGERVFRRPRGDFPLEGIVGMRANHRLNLHVASLDIATPAEPAR